MDSTLKIVVLTKHRQTAKQIHRKLKPVFIQHQIAQASTIDELKKLSDTELILVDTRDFEPDITTTLKRCAPCIPMLLILPDLEDNMKLKAFRRKHNFITKSDINTSSIIYAAQSIIETYRLTNKLNEVTNQLKELSIKDPLTNLYNNRHFIALTEAEIKKARRHHHSLSLILVDIDQLKDVNNKYGHKTGNYAIAEVAGLLRQSVREIDTIARYSGDKFAIILPGACETDAVKISGRIIRTINHYNFVYDNDTFSLTCSIGIGSLTTKIKSADELMKQANEALTEAKRRGGKTICTQSDVAENESTIPSINQRLLSELISNITEYSSDTKIRYFKGLLSSFKPYPYYKKYLLPHLERVAFFAEKLAAKYGLSETESHAMYRAGFLHDIGKLAIEPHILTKSQHLTSTEYELIKQHPSLGVEILNNALFLTVERDAILHHHEWYDGRGYPDNITGSRIPLGARIISLCEAWDVMTTKQPYRPNLTLQQAISELQRWAGRQFDPELVDVFVEMITK